MVEAEFGNGIDIFCTGNAFHQGEDGFVQHGDHDPVADKSSRILNSYRGLIKSCSKVIHFFEGIVARSKAAGDFHQFHDRSRVKEVHADEFISSLRESAEHGDGNGRGVAGNDGVFRAEFIKGLENVFFDLDVFRSGFNRQMNVAGFFRHLNNTGDAAQGCIFLIFGDAAFFYAAREVLFDIFDPAVNKFLFDIAEYNFNTMSSHDLCNTAAHLTSADNHNFL